MKASLKYLSYDLGKCAIVFSLVYIGLLAIASLVFSFGGDTNNFKGMDMAVLLLDFIIGLVVFKEYFWMFNQNGVSRKTYFKCCLIAILVFNLIIALITQIVSAVFQALSLDIQNSIVDFTVTFYPELTENPILRFIVSTIIMILSFTFSFIIGYFISVLFYKSSKAGRVAIAAGLPVTIFVVLPVSASFMKPFWNQIMKIALILIGNSYENPFFAFLTLLVGIALIAVFSYSLTKRAEIL